jgi:hypothetical protein
MIAGHSFYLDRFHRLSPYARFSPPPVQGAFCLQNNHFICQCHVKNQWFHHFPGAWREMNSS